MAGDSQIESYADQGGVPAGSKTPVAAVVDLVLHIRDWPKNFWAGPF